MQTDYPSPLTHSWPLYEHHQRFDLGLDFSLVEHTPSDFSGDQHELSANGVGLWNCDLSDNTLTWSSGVYDLFGLPRGLEIARATAVTLYREPSRAAMERLRAYAIKHQRGFTLDVELQPANGGSRWIRLVAAPLCMEGRVTRLCGYKRDITKAYVKQR
jgi:PAS domain-containing protein